MTTCLRISPSQKLLDALEAINLGVCQMVLVTDPEDRLVGVLSDGDVRRALLKGHDLQTPVRDVMSSNPVTVTLNEGRGVALLRMQQHGIRSIPVLDADRCVRDLWEMESLLQFRVYPQPVAIMAGGLGSRLAPLTEDLPKPMLPVGGQPLLELTLQHCLGQGFRQFFILVNYKAEKIMDYFEDGGRLGASITYIREDKRMGTAGALSLLPSCGYPYIVLNGDILTRLDIRSLLETHEKEQALATMAVKRHAVSVPYGVVRLNEQGRMASIEEKPQFEFPISAGINVLSPGAFHFIPPDSFFDMPNLFNALLQAGHRPAVHEIHEYWLDIGHISDYRRANEEVALYHRAENL